MPETIRRCPDHGVFEGATCPVCGERGASVVDGEQRRRLSKYLSGALRHFPDDAGLSLDDAGWTAFPDLVAAATARYDWADREAVATVIATDPKGRFERTETGTADGDDRVRAAYGHSVDVTLDAGDDPVPATLYHGTAPRHREAILAEGLRPMDRQQVHLSGTVEEAREVGRRRADDPIVFAVDAARLQTDGFDVTERGRGVYTTDRVPPAYLTER